MSTRLLAFGWYGGKFSHLDWLLPLLPTDAHHYCEPFGGSAAVLLNRPPAPVETYNDLDGEVVNFFRVLRERPDALLRAIALTPFARAELARAAREDPAGLDPVERARRFYVRARQARTGLAQTASESRWAWVRTSSYHGMPGTVSRWLYGLDALASVAARLLRVQIECRPALDVIRQYDTPGTLFYCDPPYPAEARSGGRAYRYEMSDADHEALADLLHRIRGRAAVSGYRCPLLDRLYGDWRRIDAPPRTAHSVKRLRREALWVNW